MRVMAGAILRFDSVTEMIEHCRARYRTDDVRSGTQDGEFVLFVRPADDRGDSSRRRRCCSECYA